MNPSGGLERLNMGGVWVVLRVSQCDVAGLPLGNVKLLLLLVYFMIMRAFGVRHGPAQPD